MKHYKRLPEFDKEFKKLAKRYRSLPDDLQTFEKVIDVFPTGQGNNFTIIHSDAQTVVVKARLACRALKDRSLRLIYAYRSGTFEFMYIEIYAKGDKENEDRERLKEYLASTAL